MWKVIIIIIFIKTFSIFVDLDGVYHATEAEGILY